MCCQSTEFFSSLLSVVNHADVLRICGMTLIADTFALFSLDKLIRLAQFYSFDFSRSNGKRGILNSRGMGELLMS